MLLRTIGYIAFFIVSFVLCLYLTFPWPAVKQRVLGTVSKQLGRRITASSLEPSWVTGLHAEKVSIEMDRGEPPLTLETVDARANLLTLLGGGYGGTIQIPIARGDLAAEISGSKEEFRIDGQAKGLELAVLPGLKSATGLALSGTVDLTIRNLVLGLEDPAKSQGQIRLQANALETLKGGKAGGFPVPELQLGNLDWNLPVENGKVMVRNQRLDGPSVLLNLNGEIVLAKPMFRSLVNVELKFKPTPAFLQKEPMMGSLLRNIDRYKGSDGYYTYQISGTLKRPRMTGKRR